MLWAVPSSARCSMQVGWNTASSWTLLARLVAIFSTLINLASWFFFFLFFFFHLEKQWLRVIGLNITEPLLGQEALSFGLLIYYEDYATLLSHSSVWWPSRVEISMQPAMSITLNQICMHSFSGFIGYVLNPGCVLVSPCNKSILNLWEDSFKSYLFPKQNFKGIYKNLLWTLNQRIGPLKKNFMLGMLVHFNPSVREAE